MAGVGNFEIEKIIENSSNDELRKIFIGVFPSKKINHFIGLHRMMQKKRNIRF